MFTRALRSSIILIAITCMAFIFFKNLASQLEIILNWQKFYANALDVGDDCQFAVGKWHDNSTFGSVFTSEHIFKKLRMPYRDADKKVKPLLTSQQYLITQCRIQNADYSNAPYLSFNLGRIYGDSAVYYDELMIEKQSDQGRVNLPIPPKFRDKDSFQLTIISKPIGKNFTPGLASLLPIVIIDQRETLDEINRISQFWNIESPIATMLFPIGISLTFILAWIFGIRYRDLEWMILLATLWAIHGYVDYTPIGSSSRLQYLIGQDLTFLEILALGGFITSFIRVKFKFEYVFVVFGLIYILLTHFAPSSFQRYVQLRSFVPFVYASLQFFILAFLSFHKSTQLNKVHSRRIFFYGIFTSIACVLYMIQSYLFMNKAIEFNNLLIFSSMTVFSGFLAVDLVVFHRQYLKEKTLRLEEEQEKIQLEERLVVGRSVQDKLLPKKREGKYHNFNYKFFYQPSQTMSGDWLHIWDVPGKSKRLIIGDVMGKGPQAAIVMSSIIAGLHEAKRQTMTIEAMIQYLNMQLISLFSKKTSSALSLIELKEDNTATLYNCGLPPWVYIDANSKTSQLIESSNLPLGIEENYRVERHVIELKSHKYLINYTDGILEGSRPLKKLLRKYQARETLSLDSLYLDALAAGNEHVLEDDKTLLALEFKAST